MLQKEGEHTQQGTSLQRSYGRYVKLSRQVLKVDKYNKLAIFQLCTHWMFVEILAFLFLESSMLLCVVVRYVLLLL